MQNKTKYPEAGNWHQFESFCWFEKPDDADKFCVYNLNHRDSGLLDQSNAYTILKTLKPFEDDAWPVTFSHWAVGWIDAVAVRVETRAYRTLCEIIDRVSEYPILDETDYSEREHKATLRNIYNSFHQVDGEVDKDKLPKYWARSVYSWFLDNDQSAVENLDDHGGYPGRNQLLACISSLWPDAIKGIDAN
jgi:hypothetical protein